MNEHTAALIQNLAAKLGTTTEYLWSVLIKQAPINAATDVLQYIAAGFLAYFYYKWATSDKRDYDEFGQMFAALGVGLPLLIILIAIFFCFPNTITALVNPEYWALKEILSAVKGK